jgi:hypothetical protein
VVPASIDQTRYREVLDQERSGEGERREVARVRVRLIPCWNEKNGFLN